MKKKFILTLGVSVLILANPLTFSYAKSELVEGRALGMAQQYIENSLGDEAWKGNNPIISSQSKFYTDDDKKISYIEYKVSCDSTPDCGFIMMNVDGNDVSVPIASPSGNTPSEILDQGETIDEKLYYFGPFDLYSENEMTGDVQALDPQEAVDLRSDAEVKRSAEEKTKVSEQKETLKTKLQDAKLAAKEFKKSEEFKTLKKGIEDQILSVPKEEFSMNMLDMSYADLSDTNTSYTLPGTSNIFIPTSDNSSSSGCSGKTPCYDQFKQTYGIISNCYSGCTPTAVGIIFGYYDRNGFPNLVPGTATLTNSSSSNALINSIRTHVGTTCAGPISSPAGQYYGGSSNPANAKNAKNYAINMGYSTSTSNFYSYSGSTTMIASVFDKVKTEVNAGRPILIHVNNPNTQEDGHALVGFGYKSTGTTAIARVNMGWGGSGYYTSGTIKYYKSNLDQNLNSIFYSLSNNKKAYAVTTFKISN